MHTRTPTQAGHIAFYALCAVLVVFALSPVAANGGPRPSFEALALLGMSFASGAWWAIVRLRDSFSR